MKTLILATSNSGKIAELQSILSPIDCIPQQSLHIEDAEETGLSFIENAIIKARHASHCGGKPALADDSGLVIPALNGQPGIFSARFAGENAKSTDNIKLLLSKMSGLKGEDRQGFFYCALALVRYGDDPMPLIATGKVSGFITHEAQGTQGFGYDPIFYLPEQQCTAAHLPPQIKNTISHRALALKNLREALQLED